MKRILIADDDPVISHIYQGKFQWEGFTTETVADGARVIEVVERFKPDVIILDLVMPNKTGVEVLKILRSRPETMSLPVIVFSSAYMGKMVQEAWEAGATQCLRKADCTPNHLVNAVRSAMSSGETTFIPAAPRIPMPETLAPLLPSTQSAPAKPGGAPSKPDPEPAAPEPADAGPSTEAIGQAPTAPARPGTPVYVFDDQGRMVDQAGAGIAQIPVPPQRPQAGPATDEIGYQMELRRKLRERESELIPPLRNAVQAMFKAADISSRQGELHDVYRRVRSMAAHSALAGFVRLAQLATALEALIKDIHDQPSKSSASTLRSIAHAVDRVAEMFEQPTAMLTEPPSEQLILVVDDEALSRQVLCTALQHARLKALRLSDPLVALKVLEENALDLVFLDVSMPGLNGFELCSKMRAMPAHQSTPVVFVTGLSDFETRTKSAMSGATEFIAKPFLLSELAVKALTILYRSPFQR